MAIKVVCGIIYKEDKVFICRRKSEKFLAGYWEFPGGKIEDYESPKESLTRELSEELGMDVNVLNHFQTVTHDYGNFTIELIAYLCEYKTASYILTDHDRYEWLSASEIIHLPLAPADMPIANQLATFKIS